MRGVALVFALGALGSLGLGQNRPQVVVTVEGRGAFTMELYPDQAPKLVTHFLGLVDKKFYDGMLFHRKVDGFVLQAGDPKSKGMTPEEARRKPGESGGTAGIGDGGSGKTVPFEINDLVHTKFTVGMALEAPMSDTGDSQFFINLADNRRLDGRYVVFAKVISGTDVVMRCQRGDRIRSIARVQARASR